MTLINNCSRMILEIVQRSKAPNDAWRNLESHYRVKGTREIVVLQPGEDPFQFTMEIDRFAADIHRPGDRSVTELRKCVIIVARLSADYEIEVRMLEDNPAGLERAEIERAVGNQHKSPVRNRKYSTRWDNLV